MLNFNNGKIFEKEAEIPVFGEYDVIVAGGGVAGVGAAIAVGKRGYKVLLIEATSALGGLAGKTDIAAVGDQRVAQLLLCVAVRGCNVKVVDAVFDGPCDIFVRSGLTVVHRNDTAVGDGGDIKACSAKFPVIHKILLQIK